MAIITGSRSQVGSGWDRSTDATAAFQRVEPIVTVDQLKARYLFGIPLVASLPDPITGKRAQMTDEMLQDAIIRACNTVEADVGVGFHITPVEITKRVPWDAAQYRSFGFFRLPDAPIAHVLSLHVATADSATVYEVPVNWVDPANFQKGQINIIPLMPAFTGGGNVALPGLDQSGMGAAWLGILTRCHWVAAYFTVVYVAGFVDGQLPVYVNEVVGMTAAIDILGQLAATYRVSSYSMSLDAANQSVSGPGPAIYDAAIQRLLAEKERRIGKIKARYYKKIFASNV